MYNNVTVVIPSYKPDEKLISTIIGVREAGFSDIIVVDDGGGEKYADYFARAEGEYGCTVLRHEVNKGKGAALKTAFRYYAERRTESEGLVTADADGQHLPNEIASVASAMIESGSVVLGSRDFSLPDVPSRSKTGNRITSAVFRIFFGMKIGDTQTGLRAIPRKYVEVLSHADGDRYEYETHMLFLIKQEHIPFEERQISTVYIDGNSSSHFRVFHDSVRIYSLLLKFLLSSVISAFIDISLFCVFVGFLKLDEAMFAGFVASALAARLFSSLVNYFINSNAVFPRSMSIGTFLKYYLTAILFAAVSSVLVGVYGVIIDNIAMVVLLKALSDLLFFGYSFRIQHNRVFVRKKTDERKAAS